MPPVADAHADRVLIIGGGIVGLCIAWESLHRGKEILLLDAGIASNSASRGNAGQVAPGHPPIPAPGIPAKALHLLIDRRSPLYIPPRPSLPLANWLKHFLAACKAGTYAESMKTLGAFSRCSREGFDRLQADLGRMVRMSASGIADYWLTDQGEKDAEAETNWMSTLGFKTETLTGEQLRDRDSSWSQQVRGAVVHNNGMTLDPAALCDALRQRIEMLGGKCRIQAHVDRIEHINGSWSVHTTCKQRFTGGSLVLAAGAWSTKLAAEIGCQLNMQPAKGYHVTASITRAPHLAGVLREHKIAVTPLDSGLRLAGTLELSGFNFRKDPARIRQIVRGAAEFLPEIDHCDISDAWCGLRPCTAHGLPVVHQTAPNAWVASGHGMMGLTLAPGTAKLIIDEMQGVPMPEWAGALSGPKA